MPRYVAFLRAINVGGHTVKMDRLRALFESLGFTGVETFIASGNVIFQARSADEGKLSENIDALLCKALGFEVATFLRTDAEVAAIAEYEPFPASRIKVAKALNVAFLEEPLDAAAKRTLMGLKTSIDDFYVQGREIYWLCRTRQSESKFSNAVLEKKLGLRSTLRGMGMLKRLAAKYR
jgi:uncharacterized protein (DUF1697 family)